MYLRRDWFRHGFLTGCNLGCVYCQNFDIAHKGRGTEVSAERLADIFIELQAQGANNINLVTPTNFSPQISRAVSLSRMKGLVLPIVYNTGGYEDIESLKKLEGVVDIYLTDMKYFDPDISKKYSNAPDYFEKATSALEEMVRQQPIRIFDENGIMQRGVIVRHLVLPGQTEDSMRILEYLAKTYNNGVIKSIMNQFTPLDTLLNYPELKRKLREKEYQNVVDYAWSIGTENSFIQEGETAKESFIPSFDDEGV